MGIIGLVGGARTALAGLNLVRVGLIGALAAALFIGGCMYSNTKHAEKATAQAERTAETIAELSRQHTTELARLAAVGAEKERLFSADIAEINTHRDALIEQIRVVALSKPPADVRVEACLESDDEDVRIVLANPFSDSFRLLWNQASRNLRPAGSAGADPD